jgi:hypothetical protein
LGYWKSDAIEQKIDLHCKDKPTKPMTKTFTLLILFLLVNSLHSFAQNTPIEDDRSDISFSKREAVVLHNFSSQKDNSSKIYQFLYNADLDMSNGDSLLFEAPYGQVIIESGNFKGDDKEELFYLYKTSTGWDYSIAELAPIYDRKTFSYTYTPGTLSIENGPVNQLVSDYWTYPEVETGDFDGDGLDEIAIVYDADGRLYCFVLEYNLTSQSYEANNEGLQFADKMFYYGRHPVEDPDGDLRNGFSIGSGDIDGDNFDELFISFTQQSSTITTRGQVKVMTYDLDVNEKRFSLKASRDIGIEYALGDANNVQTKIVSLKNYNKHLNTSGTEDIIVFRTISYFNFKAPYLFKANLLSGDDLTSKDTMRVDMSGYPPDRRLGLTDRTYASTGDFNGDGFEECGFLLKSLFLISRENGTGDLVLSNAGLDLEIYADNYSELFNTTSYRNVDVIDAGDMDYDGRDEILIGRPTQKPFGLDSVINYVEFITINVNDDSRYYTVDSTSIPVQQSRFSNNVNQNVYFAVELAELDMEIMTLGPPSIYDCPQFKPLVILESVPHHYDQINGDVKDVNNMYSGTASTNEISFTSATGSQDKTTLGLSSDWAFSAGIEYETEVTGFGLTAGYTANLDYNYGNQFSNSNAETRIVDHSFTVTANADDKIQISEIPFTVYTYPVLARNGDSISYLVAAFPDEEGERTNWYSGNAIYNFFPSHEPGNILSYPKPTDPDFASDELQLIYAFDAMNITNDGGAAAVFTDEVKTAIENESVSSHELTIGGSVSVGASGSYGPFGGSSSLTVKGSAGYKSTSLEIYEQELSSTDLFSINTGKVIAGSNLWEYSIVPRLYWTNDNSTKLAMAVDFSATKGTNWTNFYGQESDPALLLPHKYDSAKYQDYIVDNLDRTKSLRFDNLFPNIGDTITAIIKVFNFSLESTSYNVPFSLYAGHPDDENLISDINGVSIFHTENTLSDQGREIVLVKIVVTSEIAHSGSWKKVYIKLDPENKHTEIHEQNNIGWSKLGGDCYSPFKLSVEDVMLMDKQMKFVIYPNPASRVLNLETKQAIAENAEVSIHIFNLQGQTVFSTTTELEGFNTYSCDVSSLVSGMYVYNVVFDEKILHTGKVIIVQQ